MTRRAPAIKRHATVNPAGTCKWPCRRQVQDGMLSDADISAAMDLLAEQFPDMGGLQDPVLGSVMQFDVVTGPFVQILHDGDLHWVTAASAPRGVAADVIVYDSLYNDIGMHLKMQIASLVHSGQPSLAYTVDCSQRQAGTVDCGVFAIACATSVCHGLLPQQAPYRQDIMRRHLQHCLRAGRMTPFPVAAAKAPRAVNREVTVPLYCSCRLPDNGEERMICCGRCAEWWHQSCGCVTTEIFVTEGTSWLCATCTYVSFMQSYICYKNAR